MFYFLFSLLKKKKILKYPGLDFWVQHAFHSKTQIISKKNTSWWLGRNMTTFDYNIK